MKKILFLIESMAGGGAEKVLLDLIKHMDKKRFDVTLMTVVDTGIYSDDVEPYCTYKSFLPDPDSLNSFFSRLKYKIKYKLIYNIPAAIVYRWFIREKYDVEVAFLEGFVTKVISCSDSRKSRKLAWVHIDLINNDYADKYYINHEHHKRTYNAYDNILCVSKNVEDAFKRKFNIMDKTLVQYNPVDNISIRLKSLENIGIMKDKTTMVTAGRLVEQKGYDRLVRICRRLKDDGLDFWLWILGDGEQREILEQYICENSLEENIRLFGFQTNPYPYFKEADFFVCSSRAEGFSTVATEAIILGRPVITTDCAGMKELLGESEYGVVVENNSEALYEALKDALLNKEMIRNLQSKAAERNKDFDIRISMNKIQNILEMDHYG